MTIMGVKFDQDLSYIFSHSAEAEHLTKLDRNGDHFVTMDDYDHLEGMQARSRMLDDVSRALFPGEEKKAKFRRGGFRQFVFTFQKVSRLWNFIRRLEQERGSSFAGLGGLQFSPYQWESFLAPKITGEGEFSPARISLLSIDIYNTLHWLGGNNSIINRTEDFGSTWGFKYSVEEIPEFLRTDAEVMSKRYLEGVDFLARYYEDIECDDVGILFWDGCPENSGVSFEKVFRLQEIQASNHYEDLPPRKK